MKNILYICAALLMMVSCGKYDDGGEPYDSSLWAQPSVAKFYKGTSIRFADYLIDHGSVYKEGDEVKDPGQSIADHGGNIVRLHLNVDTNVVVTAAPVGYTIDGENWGRVREQIRKYKGMGLDIMLTLHLASDNSELLPLVWKGKGLSRNNIADSVYKWCYERLDWLGANNLMPEIIAVGNETNRTLCYDESVWGTSVDTMRKHGAMMLNAGYRAIDELNAKYGTHAIKMLHLHNPSGMEECIRNWKAVGVTDYDLIGMSWYPSMHSMGKWTSFAHIGKWCWLSARKQFMVVETSAVFTNINGDAYTNTNSIAVQGYDKTPADQCRWMRDLCQDVSLGGGLGVIYWGGDFVGTNVYAFPTFKGSSWDDKAFWTSTAGSDVHTLHEGIEWMQDNYPLAN